MWNLVSLDGFFEGPKSWEIDWHEYSWGEELEQLSIRQLQAADTLLFGRLTYQGMTQYWPSATGDVAEIMNGIAKVVFSRTLEKADWGNTTLIRSQADSAVREMKQKQGKDMLIFGSANLSSTLMQSGLIDEYRLGIVPVVLGGGSPLFKPGAGRKHMKLLEATPLGSGCIILRYGAVPT